MDAGGSAFHVRWPYVPQAARRPARALIPVPTRRSRLAEFTTGMLSIVRVANALTHAFLVLKLDGF